jgi:hypothetical protein
MGRICSLIFFVSLSFPLSAQSIVQGYVYDEKGEPLCASSIYLKNYPVAGVFADISGYFKIQIPENQQFDTLVVSFLGCKPQFIPVVKINLSENQIIRLQNDIHVLSEVSVYTNKNIIEEFAIQKLEKLDIYMSPVAAADPLKAIQVLPASTNVEESAEIALRGSSGDKSIVALNGVPVHNPVKNSQINGIGNFSLFNPEIINTQEVYPSNPPLTYGNALAGVVDIQTNEQLENNSMIFALSLANAGLMINRKLASSDNFIQIYGNIQYSKPYLALNKKSYNYLNYFKSKDIGMNFHYCFTDKLSLNLYDYFIDEAYQAQGYMYNHKDITTSGRQRWFQVLNLNYKWKPSTAVTWNSGIDVSRTDYAFSIITSHQKAKYYYNSLDIKYFIKNAKLQSGISLSNSNYQAKDSLPLLYFSLKPDAPHYGIQKDTFNHHLEIYLLTKYNLGQKFMLSIGARKNIPFHNQKNYWSYQLNIRYNLNKIQSFLLGAGSYYAYKIPSFYQSDFSLQNSKQIALSYHLSLDIFLLELAAYYKTEKTSIWSLEDLDNKDIENRIAGLELLITKELRNWIFTGSYTYLNSKYKYQGKTFNASNNLDYIIRLSTRYQGTSLWGVSLNYSMRSGLYYTPVEMAIELPDFYCYMPIFGKYNSKREKAYQSLDLSLTKMVVLKKSRITFFATISNLLDCKNIESRIYTEDYSAIKDYWYYQRLSCYMGIQISY